MNNENELVRNLKRFRRWLCENAVSRVVNGFLPTFLDDKSRKIEVIVNDSMKPCTDGKTIYVSLIQDFLEDGWTVSEWMIALKAVTAHEAEHVNSSNFTDVEEIRTWYGKYLADTYNLDPTIGVNIAADAQNIVEDGRIERIAVQRRPGMVLPFRILNEVIRDGTTITGKSPTKQGEYHDFWGNVLSYAKTGLYSPGADAYAGTRMETVFLGVQGLIDDGIASNCSSKCRDCVQEMLEDIAPYLVDLIKEDPDLENELKTQKITEEYTSNQGTPEQGGSQGSSRPNPLRVPAPSAQSATPENSGKDGASEEEQGSGKSGQQSESATTGSQSEQEGEEGASAKTPDKSRQTGFSNTDRHSDPLDPSDLDEMRRQMERELASANQAEAASKNQPDPDSPSKEDIESIKAEYSGRTMPISYTTLNISHNSELPADLKTQATTLRREITRIRESKSRAAKGLRRGTLDTGALWKTGYHEDAIFSRKRNPDAGSAVFYLLIDDSGSQAEAASKENQSLKKYQVARYSAAVVEEAVRGIFPCKIALFNQDCSRVNHYVIKGFDERKSGNRSWNSLLSRGPGGGNADSVNIRIAAMELSRRPEKKKVLFVLSDGLPSAYGSRSEAYSEVRQAVLSARRKGVIVIPIMFDDMEFLTSSQKTYELMYEKHIISCVPKEITPRLCTLFRQVICR